MAAGVDRQDVVTAQSGGARLAVEAILTADQVKALDAEGVELAPKRIGGRSAARVLAQQSARDPEVFRSYSEPGGIRDELVRTTRRYPALTELVPLGPTVQGREILAVRVTGDASTVDDGARPAVLYTAAQHAREWITPEMVRRLMQHVLERYGQTPAITRLLNTTELWFVPVANPDGYDFTFTKGNRLWRKNLRQQRRRPHHFRRRGGPQPQLPVQVGLGQRGIVAGPDKRDVPRHRSGLRAGDPGPVAAGRPGGLRVPHQLPLRRGAAALRHRLAGVDPHAGRRDLRGPGRH